MVDDTDAHTNDALDVERTEAGAIEVGDRLLVTERHGAGLVVDVIERSSFDADDGSDYVQLELAPAGGAPTRPIVETSLWNGEPVFKVTGGYDPDGEPLAWWLAARLAAYPTLTLGDVAAEAGLARKRLVAVLDAREPEPPIADAEGGRIRDAVRELAES